MIHSQHHNHDLRCSDERDLDPKSTFQLRSDLRGLTTFIHFQRPTQVEVQTQICFWSDFPDQNYLWSDFPDRNYLWSDFPDRNYLWSDFPDWMSSDQTFQTERVLIRPSPDHGPDWNSDHCPVLNQTMIRRNFRPSSLCSRDHLPS